MSEVSSSMSELGEFDVVYADPAWRFSSNSKAKPGRNAMRHYDCLRLDEICQLPVRQICAPKAMLYLWATSPMLDEALTVMSAWGFRYVSSMVWVKSRIGTGFWVRNRHEMILIGKRGKFPCPRPAHTDSVITSPTREHSRKPEDLREQIEVAYPDSRKVELFARETRNGWTSWGNEVGKFDG